MHHFVPKHMLYVPVRVTSFREIHFDFTNDLNQTLSFSSGSSVIIITLSSRTIIIISNETVARYPFSLTVHMKNGTPLYLDHAIHLNGDWEMCLSQLYLPRSELQFSMIVKLNSDMTLYQNSPPKQKKIDCGMKN